MDRGTEIPKLKMELRALSASAAARHSRHQRVLDI